MKTWEVTLYRWERSEPVEGVSFLPQDRVVILAGTFAGRMGTVVGLSKGPPEPAYEVELEDGTRTGLGGSALGSPVPNDVGQHIAWIQEWVRCSM